MIEFDRLEEVRAGIEEARGDGVAVIFKNLVPAVPSWENFLKLIDKEIHGEPSRGGSHAPFEERVINGVTIRNLFYLMVRLSDRENFPEAEQLYKIFHSVLKVELDPVSAFINIIGGEKPGEAHRDNRETIFWQCHGEAKWYFYDAPEYGHYDTDKLEIIKTIALEPGDVLFMRNKAMHSVENFGPRASIAFMPSKEGDLE